MLTVDGETNTNWIVGPYNGAQLAEMPYSDYFTLVKSYDFQFMTTDLAHNAIPGQLLSTVQPGSGVKPFKFKVSNPGKFMFTDGAGLSEAQNSGYYLHIVSYDPAGAGFPLASIIYTNWTSMLSYTDY